MHLSGEDQVPASKPLTLQKSSPPPKTSIISPNLSLQNVPSPVRTSILLLVHFFVFKNALETVMSAVRTTTVNWFVTPVP